MSDEAEVWDYLHERFGFGDWDEATSDIPFWKFRGNAIGQLKAMLRKRRVRPAELVVAAEYAIAHNKPITALWELFSLVGEANAWARRQERAAKTAALVGEVEAAIAEAIDANEPEWAERLFRAAPSNAETVINEWRNR